MGPLYCPKTSVTNCPFIDSVEHPVEQMPLHQEIIEMAKVPQLWQRVNSVSFVEVWCIWGMPFGWKGQKNGKTIGFCTMTMLSHFPRSAAVFGEKPNLNHRLAPILSHSMTFWFSQDRRLCWKVLFFICGRNSIEHNSRSHIHAKRGLQEGLPAVAGLL